MAVNLHSVVVDSVRFSAAHFLMGMRDACARLHGHTYSVRAKVTGNLDDVGVVLETSLVREAVLEILGPLFHRVLVATGPRTGYSVERGRGDIRIRSADKSWTLPDSDCALLPITATSTECLAELFCDRLSTILRKQFPNTQIKSVEVVVADGMGDSAEASNRF